MTAPPRPDNEQDRLNELHGYDILDTPPEKDFDDLTSLASHICGVPIALMTLVDADRQWFKSNVGLPVNQTSRAVSFCGHALGGSELFVVPDACQDPRFADNPLVTQDPNIRFYAGAPLVTRSGYALGTMCVIDRTPRSLTPEQQKALGTLSRQAVTQMELRRALVREREYLGKLTAEQERSERLLLNILPPAIAQRLKSSRDTIAECFESVTVLFADVQDFGQLTRRLKPQGVVGLLSAMFSRFDRLCDDHGVTKIKTIGDAYMAASGLPERRPDHAEAAANLALAMQQEVALLKTELREPLSLRVGVHTGPAVAGVVGTARLAYDLWGETVNVAAQMESMGLGGNIQVTRAVHDRLAGKYLFEPRGEFYLKGSGEIETFLLKGRRR